MSGAKIIKYTKIQFLASYIPYSQIYYFQALIRNTTLEFIASPCLSFVWILGWLSVARDVHVVGKCVNVQRKHSINTAGGIFCQFVVVVEVALSSRVK